MYQIFPPGREAVREKMADAVARALLTLSSAEREVVVLHIWDKKSFREIAAMRQISPDTVEWIFQDAVGKILPLVVSKTDLFRVLVEMSS